MLCLTGFELYSNWVPLLYLRTKLELYCCVSMGVQFT